MVHSPHSRQTAQTHADSASGRSKVHRVPLRINEPDRFSQYSSAQPCGEAEWPRGEGREGPSGTEIRTGPVQAEQPGIITHSPASVRGEQVLAKFHKLENDSAGGVGGLDRTGGLNGGLSIDLSSPVRVERLSTPSIARLDRNHASFTNPAALVHSQRALTLSTPQPILHQPGPCPLGSYSSLSPFATPRPASPEPQPALPTFPTHPRTLLDSKRQTHQAPDPWELTSVPTDSDLSSSPTRLRGRSPSSRSPSSSPVPRTPTRRPADGHNGPLSPASPSTPLQPPSRRHRRSTSSPSPSVSPTTGGPAGRRTTFPPSSLTELQLAWDRGEYYPTAESVAEMMLRSGLTRVQVRGWFANRRQRAGEEERAAVAEEARRMGVAGVPF